VFINSSFSHFVLFLRLNLFRMILHNKIDKQVLKQSLLEEDFQRVTLSFYKFVHIPDPQAFRDELYVSFSDLFVFGRIYVASEGINAQLSVPEENLEVFKRFVSFHRFMQDVLLNKAIDDNGKSFYKLKIQVKHKILSDGLDNSTFDIYQVGDHLDADSFNRKLDEPNTLVIDLRNHYEHEVGHIEGAVLPEVDTYKESIPLIINMLEETKPDNIVMYCTGGIRCEKFSAYLKHKGFQNVFQLKGGVINYVNQVRKQGLPVRFRGKNFVFDERMGERVTQHVIARCHQCKSPADTHVNCANPACHLLFIQCTVCAEKYAECCSVACREFIQLPVEAQKMLRKRKTSIQTRIINAFLHL